MTKALGRSWYLQVWQRYRALSAGHRPGRDRLIIYQMGKVGSSSLKASLDAALPGVRVYQVHALTKERLAFLGQRFRTYSRYRGKPVVHDHYIEGQFLRRRLRRPEEHPWKVITVVRDPVARNVSSFFQAFRILEPGLEIPELSESELSDREIDKLIDAFHSHFEHDYPMQWFDRLFRPVFGIDVYERHFDPARGWALYEEGWFDLVILRLESLNETAPAAVQALLGLDRFELVSSNISAAKRYARNYARFKERLRLPEAYLDRVYESRLMRHFYTAEERATLRSRWARG